MNHLLAKAVRAFVDGRVGGPSIRVLEVGAGTGATTASLLPHLPPGRTDYLFTDVSPLFLARARQQLGDVPWMRTHLLDIEQDPLAQGLAPHSFDLIIAAHVVHATEELGRTLQNLRTLLAPNGVLALVEPTTRTLTSELTFGLLPGWWRFTDSEVRSTSPLLSASEWAPVLADAGFGQVAAICPTEMSEASAGAAVLLCQAEPAEAHRSKTWVVFADCLDIGEKVSSSLDVGGDRCVLVSLGSGYRRTNDHRYEIDRLARDDYARVLDEVIGSTVAEEAPECVFVCSLDSDDLEEQPSGRDIREASRNASMSFLYLVRAAVGGRIEPTPQLRLVTRGGAPALGEIGVHGLVASTVWSVGKVVAREHPELHCSLVDFDPTATDCELLVNELRAGPRNEEVALRDDKRFVARLARSETMSSASASTGYTLAISSRGTPANLQFGSMTPRAPDSDEVQVRVKATGLNFADVMDALGLLPFDRSAFGVEFAGEVVEVGANVANFHPGDLVFGAAPGSFDSHVTAHASRIRRIPRGLTCESAATITTAFATAWYSLNVVAGMRAGDRVLIHAAGGGVGLAAVQLAQLCGAQVFATAHPDKWERLRQWGVEHLMSSRTSAFADEVLSLTDGEGVDIVLNSLTGDMIPQSLRVMRAGGRFVEIGKREIWTQAQVAGIKQNVSYHVVDLLEMLTGRGDSPLLQMLDPLISLFENERLRPLPHMTFATEEIVAAFRFMQQSRHFGKVVVKHHDSPVASQLMTSRPARFRQDASYLITGGLGGLGLVAAEWLVRRGARHLALMSRREPQAEALARIRQLEELGASVLVVCGDVSNDHEISRALEKIGRSLPPLRGVIHSAAVLDDAIALNQTAEKFDNVLRPKVDGAWSLHSQTQDLDLDFMIFFSAGASLLGNPGQANYVSANAFLDALAHYRRQKGLAAMSVNWGPWSGVGMAAARGLDTRMSAIGVSSIDPTHACDIFDRLYAWNPVQAGVLPIDWQVASQHLVEWPFVSEFRGEANAIGHSDTEFGLKLEGVPVDEQRALVSEHVRNQIAAVLGYSDSEGIGLRQGFFELGMDSLTAVELRNRLQSSLGLTLPHTVAFDYPTVGGLIDFVSRQVVKENVEQADLVTEDPVVDQEVSSLLARVAAVSDADALGSLRRRGR